MRRGSLHRFIAALAAVAVALVCAAPARAIVLETTAADSAPSNSVIGRWFKAPGQGNASVVVVDPNWVLTVMHSTGSPATGAQVSVDGILYNVTNQLTYSSTVDMRLCQIANLDGTPANLTTYASIYTGGQDRTVGMTTTLGGYGVGAGTPILDSTGGAVIGYNWNSTIPTAPVWGCNKVDQAVTLNLRDDQNNLIYSNQDLRAHFDQVGSADYVNHEAIFANFDSGGGWFVDITGHGDFRLVGLNEVLNANESGPAHPLNQAVFNPADQMFAVSTAYGSYLDWIETTLGRTRWTLNSLTTANWTTAGNWSNGIPNGQGAYAILGDNLNSGMTVRITSTVTLGTLFIEGTHPYTISATGSGAIVFDATAGSALLNVSGSGVPVTTMAVPITLNVPLVVNQQTSGNLLFSQPITGSFGITKTGPGMMTLSAASSAFSGGITVAQGLVRVTTAGALGTGDVTLAGGSLGWRGSASTAYANNVNVIANAAIGADASSGSGQTFTLGGLAVTGDRSVTFTSTAGGCTVAFSGQAGLSGLSTGGAGATFNTASANLMLSGGLAMAGGTLTKTGSGSMTVAGPQAYSAPSALVVAAGSAALNSDAGPPAAPYRLSVTASGTSSLAFGSTQHLASLTLADSAAASVGLNGSRVILANALAIGPAAKLDLGDNDLVLNYSGDSPLKTVEALIKAGGGTKTNARDFDWNGASGITTSAITGADKAQKSLGLRDNGYPLINRAPMTEVDGVAVSADCVVVKYTWIGDMDLDGKVTVNDYLEFLQYYAAPPPAENISWMTGDFNYDGLINVNDYLLLLGGYDAQTGPLAADEQVMMSFALAPEPATLAMLALGAGLVLRRRRAVSSAPSSLN
jgi:autotransporter-associated beta strand protein